MAKVNEALVFIFGTEVFAGLDAEDIKYFLKNASTNEDSMTVLLSPQEAESLGLTPNETEEKKGNVRVKCRKW